MDLVGSRCLSRVESNGRSVSLRFGRTSRSVPGGICSAIYSFSGEGNKGVCLNMTSSKVMANMGPRGVLRVGGSFIATVRSPVGVGPPLCLSVGRFSLSRGGVLRIFIPDDSRIRERNDGVFSEGRSTSVSVAGGAILIRRACVEGRSRCARERVCPFIGLRSLHKSLVSEIGGMTVARSTGRV